MIRELHATLVGLAAALCCAGAAAQQPGEKPAAPAAGDLCTIRGHVLRADTGGPIQGAHVAVYPGGGGDAGTNYGAKTDEAGLFVVHGVAPGRYFLYAARDGFTSQASMGPSYSQGPGRVTLERGETSNDVIFRLVRWAVIAGKVTDEDGEPLAGARVEALRSTSMPGGRRVQQLGADTSNDLGEYRIWNLPPGKYYIRATFTGRWSLSPPAGSSSVRGTAASTAYPPEYYPGTAEPSRAIRLELKGGQEIDGLDLGLAPVRAFAVRGSAWDAVHGRPLEGCCVMLRVVDDSGSGAMQNILQAHSGDLSTKGAFEFRDVPSGHYELIARTMEENRLYFARTRVDVNNGDVEGVELSIARGTPVRGSVSIEGSQTVEIGALHIRLRASGETPMAGQVYTAQVKADGTFVVEDVPEGEYEMDVFGPHRGTYLKTAQMNGVDLLQNNLMLGAGGAKGEMRVVLSAGGATVDGTVTDEDGQSVPDATVVLALEGEQRRRSDFYRSAQTDAYGKFAMTDLRPGEYTLFSWRKMEGNPWMDPEFLQPVEDKGARVSLGENGHSAVELKVLPNSAADDGPQ